VTTKDGLRCEECEDWEHGETYEKETYAPSFKRGWTEQFATDRKKAEQELPETDISVQMKDGSTFNPGAVQSHAISMAGNSDELLSEVATKTEEFIENEVEPGIKHDEVFLGASPHVSSQQSYDTHAELAPLVVFDLLQREIHRLVYMCLSSSYSVSNIEDTN
jgi:hypothetical protein